MENFMEISMEKASQLLYGEPSMKTELLAIAAMATALQDKAAVRAEHNTEWQQLRVSIDQALALATDTPKLTPDAKAFGEMRDQVQTLAAVIDLQGEKLDAIGQALPAV